jgi:hypothetical protein
MGRWLMAAMGVALIAGGSVPAAACGGPPICTVKDPTGTPLNVRLSPKGKILSNLKNGQQVEVIDHQEIGGKRWARIGRFSAGELASDAEGGWVFADYLRCKGDVKALPGDWTDYNEGLGLSCTVRDPTGTPLNVRGEPGGPIWASVRNGTVLRAALRKTHKGKSWVYVSKWGGDNAIGWVFDPYLVCEEDGGH